MQFYADKKIKENGYINLAVNHCMFDFNKPGTKILDDIDNINFITKDKVHKSNSSKAKCSPPKEILVKSLFPGRNKKKYNSNMHYR